MAAIRVLKILRTHIFKMAAIPIPPSLEFRMADNRFYTENCVNHGFKSCKFTMDNI